MRVCSSSVSGSACVPVATGIRERLLSGSNGPTVTMFSSVNFSCNNHANSDDLVMKDMDGDE